MVHNLKSEPISPHEMFVKNEPSNPQNILQQDSESCSQDLDEMALKSEPTSHDEKLVKSEPASPPSTPQKDNQVSNEHFKVIEKSPSTSPLTLQDESNHSASENLPQTYGSEKTSCGPTR